MRKDVFTLRAKIDELDIESRKIALKFPYTTLEAILEGFVLSRPVS